MFRHFRPLFHGPLIANVNMAADRGNRLIEAGLADLVAFGRLYIADPDLVERLATGARWQIDRKPSMRLGREDIQTIRPSGRMRWRLRRSAWA